MKRNVEIKLQTLPICRWEIFDYLLRYISLIRYEIICYFVLSS